jgi:20S proteasome alpha/beta subunit
VSVLAAGYDKENGPQLFQIDPSGAAFGWKATAIGKNYVNAKNFLERRYNEVSEGVCIVVCWLLVRCDGCLICILSAHFTGDGAG